MSDAQQVIQQLQRENTDLRAELQKRIEADQKAADRRVKAIRGAGSLLLPVLDRKRVARNFLGLFDTVSKFSGPQEQWPDREEILLDSRALALSLLRFMIRRRMMMLLFMLIGFVIPGLQVYLFVQQNEIMRNQEKFFRMEFFDIVARGTTSGDMNSKQITSSVLARADIDLLHGIITDVFETDFGVAFTEQDIDARSRRMRDAAFRGHLILAQSRSLKKQSADMSLGDLNDISQHIFQLVIDDASRRVPELLRFGRSTVKEDGALAEEVYRYLYNIGTLMREHYKLAHAVGKEKHFFATIAPLLGNASARRPSSLGESSPFFAIFFGPGGVIQEMLIDLAQGAKFGEPVAPIGDASVSKLLTKGFATLKAGIGEGRGVNFGTLKRLAEVP